MPITPISTVIELFYPEGFAHDYEWTTRALGMKHIAVWNDTCVRVPLFFYRSGRLKLITVWCQLNYLPRIDVAELPRGFPRHTNSSLWTLRRKTHRR
jgi:hypothetical protein